MGMTWAFIWSSFVPERRDALLQSARAFGEHRFVCGVRSNSGVDLGHLMGQASYPAQCRKTGN
jgi:acid phosphatase (class A)